MLSFYKERKAPQDFVFPFSLCFSHLFSVMKRKHFAEVPDLPHTGIRGVGLDGAVLGFFRLSNVVLLCFDLLQGEEFISTSGRGQKKDIKLSRFYQVSLAEDLVASCQC